MGGSQSTNNFSGSSTAEDVIRDIDLSGKVIIITGSNTGIGKESARVLYKQNGHVIMACRDQKRMDDAIADIKANISSKGQIEGMILDLGDLDSVKQFVKDFTAKQLPLHILMCNAGVMVPPYGKSKQGFETQMGVNHFGHFALTNLLLPILKQTAENTKDLPVRIVVTSSVGHKMGSISFDDMDWSKRGYSSWKAYGQSKLANILFAKELAKKLEKSNLSQQIHTYSLHPGAIPTELGRDRFYVTWFYKLGSIFMKSIPQGAATQVYCASAPECQNETGLYYSDCNVAVPSDEARNDEVASKLWQVSEELTGITYPL